MSERHYTDNDRYIAGMLAAWEPNDALDAVAKANAAENMRVAMARYGEHRWWLSEDPREVAYYQLHEHILLIDGAVFLSAIATLVAHEITRDELAWAAQGIRAEATVAWRAYQRDKAKGTPV